METEKKKLSKLPLVKKEKVFFFIIQRQKSIDVDNKKTKRGLNLIT
jgi:hypothetical protein